MTDAGRGRESEGDRRVSLLYLLKALAQGSGDSDKGDWEGVREWVLVREATPECSQTEQTPNTPEAEATALGTRRQTLGEGDILEGTRAEPTGKEENRGHGFQPLLGHPTCPGG